jgi:molybdopterin converting factor small subunit
MTDHIEIRLYATLQKFLPDSADQYAISPGLTVESLINELKVPKDQAKLIFINGARSDFGYVLKGGDRLGIFPPVGGG